VKLLGHSGLSIPFVVLTDLDPNGAHPPRARGRVKKLLDIIDPEYDYSDGTDDDMFEWGREQGIFVNGSTLEVDLFGSGLEEEIQSALEAELSMSQATLDTLQEWVDDPDQVDADKLLKLIERVGKGRFAQRLAAKVSEDNCPDYIRRGLERIRNAVT
jgi:putative ATP-dependent endonuclease of the OLD family